MREKKGVSVIVPAYNNSKYLRLFLQSAFDEGASNAEVEVVIVVDGLHDKDGYDALERQYTKAKWIRSAVNAGFAAAVNIGVYFASHDNILLVNEDNVLPFDWAKRLESLANNEESWFAGDTTILTLHQIEPVAGSTLGHGHWRGGDNAEEFDMMEWHDVEIEQMELYRSYRLERGWCFPILMKRRFFVVLGGFDTLVPSTFVSDVDFLLRAAKLGARSRRVLDYALYHFVSKSTKRREGADAEAEAKLHEMQEREAYRYLKRKFGGDVLRSDKDNMPYILSGGLN